MHKKSRDQHANRSSVATYNLEPRNFRELLDDVEEVQHEQYPGEPETTHGHGIEPSSPAVTAVGRDRYAYKSQEIQHLKEDMSDAIIIHETVAQSSEYAVYANTKLYPALARAA